MWHRGTPRGTALEERGARWVQSGHKHVIVSGGREFKGRASGQGGMRVGEKDGVMGKLLKWLGGILVLVLVVAIGALFLIDPNDYRDEIAGAVHRQTGREFAIEGDIRLSLFPWVGVELESVRLGNAAGFGTDPFLYAGAVQVRVRLLPLLHKQVEMSRVVLNGLRLNLARDAQGHTNWDDLVQRFSSPSQQSATARAPAPAAAPSGSPLGALAGLSLGGISVQDAAIRWDDAQAGQRLQLKPVNLELGALAPGQAVPVKFQLGLQSSQPPAELDLRGHGQVRIAASLDRLDIAPFGLHLTATGKGVPGGKLSADLDSRARLDLARDRLALENLQLSALGLKLALVGTAEGLRSAPRFNGSLKLDPFSPRTLLGRLGVELPPMADAKALGKAALDTRVVATPHDLALDGLTLTLDDSHLGGQVKVLAFKGPVVRYGLMLDGIDVDRYLPPPAKDGGKGGGTAAAGSGGATPATAAAGGSQALPLDLLRALDVAGTLKIGRLKVAGVRSQDLVLTLKAAKGRIRLHPARASLYQGSYQGDLRLDVRGKQPRFQTDERLQGVQAGPLLQDLLGQDRLQGKADVSVRLSGRSLDPVAVRPTLNGKLAFRFADGAIEGVDIARLIREAQARIKGRSLPPANGPVQTDFTELSGTATITRGILVNKDLAGKSPLLRVSGHGRVDLPGEKLDYLLTTRIVGTLQGQGGKDLAQLKGLAIPVRIWGDFSAPRYQVRLEKVLGQAVKAKAKRKVQQKLQQKLQKKLGTDLGNKLKGLFGR